MKITHSLRFGLRLFCVVPTVVSAIAVDLPRLSIRSNTPNGPRLEISWLGVVEQPGGLARPYFELQRSFDLKLWQPVGQRLRAPSATPGQLLRVMLDQESQHAFYRLLTVPEPSLATLGAGGAEVFGYAAAFDEELKKIGQITPQQFATRFPAPTNYVPGVSWDPTTADFWPAFSADPEAYNVGLIPGVDDLRNFDFRLNADELATFKKNGFVVSERLGAPSCGEIFSRLWTDDLPVFIATDPILQAWHRSYDMMLAELEETFLYENLRLMLDGMASKVTDAAVQAGMGPLKDSVLDADYFLTVARSLLTATIEVRGGGFRSEPVYVLSPAEIERLSRLSALGQSARVAATLKAIEAEQLETCFDLFGEPRAVDFSQFKPRGHYTDSERLRRYFKCVIWLGRTDLRVAGGPFQDSSCALPHMASPRELGTAIVLNHLLNEAGQFERWLQFDRLIQTFVGWTDSMTFAQLDAVLHAAGVRSLADVRDLATLTKLQDALMEGQLGVQNINSDFFISPFDATQARLPQSFTVFGQKFVLDSWALGQTVFDRILWIENGQTNKVGRRVPSALDVAFSVLGNDQIVPDLVARMTTTDAWTSSDHAVKFRDGFHYQHNLAAARAVVDQHPASAWEQNVYMQWLATLRELSVPTGADARLPGAMRTRAWAMKDLNTQLASWTQLRHDTILYAKQSYTWGDSCSYPAGFVEPRVNFWRRLQQMARGAAALIGQADYSGTFSYQNRFTGDTIVTNLTMLQSRQVAFFSHFADVACTLLAMSEKELRQELFIPAESDFISTTLVGQRGYAGNWSVRDGWYPKLFYRPISREISPDPNSQPQGEGAFQQDSGATRWDALVADVHTDVPCDVCGDPGSVLHEGVGRAFLLMVAVDNGPDRMVYAGPVLSHYEFELVGPPQRLSDLDWKARFGKAGFYDSGWDDPDLQRDWSGIPPNPEWTRSYLVPMKR